MINKDSELEIEKICRSCLAQNDQMHNVFENKSDVAGRAVQLSEMLMACASIRVASGDGLPFLLCLICENKLNTAFEFKEQCEKSDNVLRDLTNQPDITKTFKEEVVVQPDLDESLYDDDDEDDEEEDSSPQNAVKRKRGRPKKKTTFTCTYCHKVLQTKKGMRVHERRHTGDRLRYCFICNAQFTRTNHLIRHLNTHDKPGVEHACGECDATFTTASQMYQHVKTHTENAKVLEHPVENIKSEAIEHNPDEPNISNEDNDGILNSFGNSDRDDDFEANDGHFLKVEIKKEKKDKALYECKECSKVMTTYVGLKIHMRRHTGNDLAICRLCDKSFTKKSHLNRHMLTHGQVEVAKSKQNDKDKEKKVKIMECDFCDRKFKYKKSFHHHMQAEHGMSDDSDFAPEVGAGNSEGVASKEKQDSNKEASEITVDKIDDITNQTDTVVCTPEQAAVNDDNYNDDDIDVKVESLFQTIKNRKVHRCHVCGAVFARANHLTRHMTLHRALLIHKCERCDKAYATSEYLVKHVEEEHVNKPYVCTICNKPFSRGEHLIRHLKVHQTQTVKDDKLKCSICEHTFTRSDHLARHTKIHLLQDKRHVCYECGKAFNRLDNLKTHQRIHTGIKDNSKLHLCIYCGKEFNNSSNMIVHMRRHTGERPYKCAQCGKGFPRSHDLKCHERTHSGEKPYLCTLCGKSFNKSNKLLRHSRVHTGERPYVCSICSRAFTQSNDLALHMRRHTGARPYACGVCPARFIQSGQLKTHRRTTNHWMETQPDLKGGHRVEPVTPVAEPTPIRFKSHGKSKKDEPKIDFPSQEIVGIINNIKIPEEVQPLVIDSTKIAELQGGALMALPSVIHTANGDEIKFKSEAGTFDLSKCSSNDKHDQAGTSSSTAFQGNSVSVTYTSVSSTSNTFNTTENFTFQTFE